MPDRRPAPAIVQLSLLSFATFLVGTNGFMIAGLLPDIATGLQATTREVGFSISVYAAVVAVLSPTLATLLVRVPRAWLIAAGAFVFAIGTLLNVVADDVGVFILGRAVAGVGGAAIVPTAIGVASSIVPPDRRGRAISIVTLGFTLSTAVGAPLGTFVAHLADWRVPFAGVGVLSVVAVVATLLLIHGGATGSPVPFLRRFSVLADPRILFAVLSTVFTIAGFNVAYVFSSTYTGDATGGSGALLGALLLIFGFGGILGNRAAGGLTDRYGSRPVGTVLQLGHIVVLAVMPLGEGSFVALAIMFAIWGIANFGTGIPVQHRLASIDPERATIALSWYPTAVYLGIAIAPLLGGVALDVAGPSEIPHAAALGIVVSAVLFQIGYLVRRRPEGVDPGRIPR